MNKTLENIGLTKNETLVYLAFLKQGERTAAGIAKILNMDKSSAYRAVENLIIKNLLISNPRKRGTTYAAASPEILKELVEIKKYELKTQESQLNDLIGKLIKESETTRKTSIKIRKGIQAIRDGMECNLEAALGSNKIIKEFYDLSFPYFKNAEHVKWVNEFARRRIKAGVSILQIVNFAGSSVFAPIMKTDLKLLKQVRTMPKEMTGLYGLRISGDITSIISFDEQENYIDITIKDKYVALLMNSLFDFIWRRCE